MKIELLLVFTALLSPVAAAGAPGRADHSISAEISPQTGEIKVSDRIKLAEKADEFLFTLHAGLNPSVNGSPAEELSAEEAARLGLGPGGAAPLAAYRARPPSPSDSLTIEYAGRISHAPGEQAQEYARSFSETPGLISPEGCYLSGASGWYPRFGGEMVTFSLRTSLPAGYDSVAAGERTGHRSRDGRTLTTWQAVTPQDEITMTCGRYSEYHRAEGRLDYYAFLLDPEEELAGRYLQATGKYIKLYSDLLGPYPYGKFALVENFWDTGYGMPSFTLLGRKVIRLPFIIRTSYPHEILHNWWGNGVFVDYSAGNWCEGLTAYLADYLAAENQGKGRDHRMTALQKYSDYVSGGADFPLTGFKSRHSSASEAVGYGKAMMMYHMLRGLLGDDNFRRGLRAFYADNLFRTASFSHLRAAFEKITGPGRLQPFFDQWVGRAGAPDLKLKNAGIKRGLEGYDLEFTLEQAQDGPAYALEVPAAIYLPGHPAPRMKKLRMSGKSETYQYSVPEPPLRLEIDPEFDLFRRLDPLETPPTLSRMLGAAAPVIIIPAGAPGEPWRALAAAWKRDPQNTPTVLDDSALAAPPDSSAYWLLGGENRFASDFASRLESLGAVVRGSDVTIAGRRFERAGNTFVFASANPSAPALGAALVVSGSPAALPALAAKLPHYGKYSWLVFDPAMTAIASGVWDVRSSPLAADFTGSPPPPGPYPARAPLAFLPSDFDGEAMAAQARRLAQSPGGRAPGTRGHLAAASHIVKAFEKAGLEPFQGKTLQARGQPGAENIIGMVKGRDKPGEYVVVCAHYDHLPQKDGATFPGADDNASGVAMMLELAGRYAAAPPARSVVFAAFDGEEDGRVGSLLFVNSLPGLTKSRINAAVNLDTVGRLGAGRIAALGSGSSDKWVHILRGAGFVTGHDHAAAGDLDAGDQASFIAAGIPAIQLFSGPHADYHKPTDTPDKLDPRGMAKIAEFAKEIIDYLAGDSDFITRPAGSPAQAGGAPAERKASTGLVPDFTFTGDGVRAQEIRPGSPLAAAGLAAGDVIIALDGVPTPGLKDYAGELKKYAPGTRVRVTYLSGGAEKTAEIELAGR